VRTPLPFAFAVFALGAASLHAQDSLLLDPEVASVVSGGSWTGLTETGTYRITVVTGGWEHVGSFFYIQWLAEDSQQQRVVVRMTRLVKELLPGFVSLGKPELRCGPTCRVTVSGTNSRSMEKGNWTIVLGPPGTYSVTPK
jgi:hypothetical protein